MWVGAVVAEHPNVWAGVDVCMGVGIGVADNVPGSIGLPFGSQIVVINSFVPGLRNMG